MNRSNLAYLVVFALATSSAACAPRVSKHGPSSMHPSLAPIYAPAEPETKLAKRPAQAAPVEQPVTVSAVESKPAEPVLIAHSSLDAKPARPAVERRVETPVEEPAPVVRSTAKTNFYAFSDAEVTGLRKRSGDFKKLHDKLKSCTAKSEASIQRREQVRDDIIRLQNEEIRTAKLEKQLIALRLEERKLKAARGEGEDCSKIEVRLTEMLRTAYGANETAGARH